MRVGEWRDIGLLSLAIWCSSGFASWALLFSAYASKLFEVIKLYLPNAHAFTDDTQLYLSFNPDNSLNEAEALHSMEQCIRAIRAWMQVDKLKLNENKTEVMLI